jgi:lysophospholipase L1-like esterase
MLYAALGDSITYGYSASKEGFGYVHQIKRSLERQNRVSLYLHAKPGWTSAQLRKSLKKVPDCIWSEARVITLLVGGNDLIKSAPWLLDARSSRITRITERFSENLTEIVRVIRRPQGKIMIGTIYNPFPNSPLVDEYTQQMNQVIRTVARRERLILADINKCFCQKEHLYIDGFRRGVLNDFKLIGNPIHPNDKGHQAIADVYMRAYRAALSKMKLGRPKNRNMNRSSSMLSHRVASSSARYT